MSLRRVYETTIIINAALEDPDIDSVISKITSYLENQGSEIEETNKWGRRRLAYPINKKYNGYYVHLVFNSAPSIIPALERFLTLEDTILRHLTLKLDSALREYRRERSLAEGKSGETLMSSVSDETSSTSDRNSKNSGGQNREDKKSEEEKTVEPEENKEAEVQEETKVEDNKEVEEEANNENNS